MTWDTNFGNKKDGGTYFKGKSFYIFASIFYQDNKTNLTITSLLTCMEQHYLYNVVKYWVVLKVVMGNNVSS